MTCVACSDGGWCLRGNREVVEDAIPLQPSDQSRSIFFFVLIRMLRESLTPEILPRLQAFSPDLLLRRLIGSSDPSNFESSLRMAVLNYNLIPHLNIAS